MLFFITKPKLIYRHCIWKLYFVKQIPSISHEQNWSYESLRIDCSIDSLILISMSEEEKDSHFARNSTKKFCQLYFLDDLNIHHQTVQKYWVGEQYLSFSGPEWKTFFFKSFAISNSRISYLTLCIWCSSSWYRTSPFLF